MGPKSVCVFCSANEGLPASFHKEAEILCAELSKNGAELLYGGSRDGLMGFFADEALRLGVPVRGALTKRLDLTSETRHKGLTELVMVKDLFERKQWFLEKADAFVVFPGGIGTLDEALEVISWKGLGEIDKPIVFVNVDGFWDSMVAMFQDLAKRGVLREGALKSFDVVPSSRDVFQCFEAYRYESKGV